MTSTTKAAATLADIQAETPEETAQRTTGPGTHGTGGRVAYLVWDPRNSLLQGVHSSEEDAALQIAKLGAQPSPHGPLYIVEAPSVLVANDDLAKRQ